MKSVLIAGYYGYDLIGDEAILEAMLNDLRKLRPDLRFIVTSQSPEKTKADYNVETIPLCDTKAIIDMIEECDLVIVGGGGCSMNMHLGVLMGCLHYIQTLMSFVQVCLFLLLLTVNHV
jgi:polysaccharide pyruvyl transferase WcaK-like protein